MLSILAFSLALAGSLQDTPDAVLVRIRLKIESLQAKPQPDLYVLHLKSVLALSQAEVLKLQFGNEAQSKEVLGYLQTIDHGLNDDGDKAETYLRDGTRALTLARLSKVDGSLQYCTVGLPPHWDPSHAYPMIVGMHGAGPRIPLAYVNFTFLPHGKSEKPLREVITVVPWGRGNRGWRDDGESDLWEAIEEVKSFAKVDPDRCYMAGHSMGADGVWAIAQRTPDLWAAVAMMAGSTYSAPPELGLVPNAAHLPFYIWIGDQDSNKDRIPSSQQARDALAAVGNTPTFVLQPGVGHSPRGEDEDAKTDWLLRHVRRRPDHFSFVVDTLRHRGVWGVFALRRNATRATLPEPNVKFEVWIEGQRVRIEAPDAPKMRVDLGSTGLGMTGDVEVVFNGKSVFNGPVPITPIEIG
ncbi:dienelactone hydrolase family protein [Fimbriimonas ginsengisoli]|uniref:Phospholipase/carboxylesterase n=1 Tax=Fimbriimonas ginsengisoli Gsoil 348 TaxID=661478 RepID=A0A068NUN6_FIMGI|nr:dienelactone hydrolase family protein [Fimbriimonas ginsengisoli]AIE87253.1 phospholipase/carboxylesterase [Fimbriimonas ginsengisoli Gsoil 348]